MNREIIKQRPNQKLQQLCANYLNEIQILKEELMRKSNSLNDQSQRSKSQLPPAYKRIEDNMASHFSTKVKLDRKRNGKGTVTIEFYNDNDLERIMEMMNL